MNKPAHHFAQNIDDDRWLFEIGKLKRELKSEHGITDVKVGMELEIVPVHNGTNNNYCTKRSQFISEVAGEIVEPRDRADRPAAFADKAEQMQSFSPAEILMYDLIEKNPRTKNILEYSFGKGELGAGYYDNPGVLEARLKYVSVEDLIRNHRTFIHELAIKMQEYGLRPHSGDEPRRHISLSFWKDQDNLMDVHCPLHILAGRQVAEGMTRALYDGFALMRNPHLSQPMRPWGLDIDRTSMLRLAKERFEVRLPSDDKYQHIEAVITVAMAGALYGLRHPNDSTLMAQARPIDRAIFTQEGHAHTHVLHVLNAAKCEDGQQFIIKTRYFKYALANVCAELGLVDRNSREFKTLDESADRAFEKGIEDETFKRWSRAAINLLQHIQFDGSAIQFPTELSAMQGKISSAGIFKSFCIDGYLFGPHPTPQENVCRLVESDALKETLTKGLFSRLVQRATDAFGNPSSRDQEIVRILNAAALERTTAGDIVTTGRERPLQRRDRVDVPIALNI